MIAARLAEPVIAYRSIGTPRLLAAGWQPASSGLVAHRQAHQVRRLPDRMQLTDDVNTVALRGRGGAGFPVGRKLAALPRRGARSVVVNGSEGEPLSFKDRVLMRVFPHLVIDGALAVAHAVRARQVVIVATDELSLASLRVATAERLEAGIDNHPVQVVAGPGRFVAGEARAVIELLDGRAATPIGRRILPTRHGVGGRPTFLSNAETFAQIALLVSLGTFDFAQTGVAGEPGTSLVTVAGAVERPGVVEVPTGIPLSVLLAESGAQPGAVLFGGYHGSWLEVPDVQLSRQALAGAGGSFGAGSVTVLGNDTCAIGEIARVARWLAGESTRQCGPCLFGLDALADDLDRVVLGDARDWAQVQNRLAIIPGRGACAHPDGAVRFLSSSLRVFRPDIDRHVHDGGCGRPVLRQLPVDGIRPPLENTPSTPGTHRRIPLRMENT